MAMTKEKAVKLYKEENVDFIKANKKDKVALRTDWNNFTDYLLKDGEITESQYNNWSNPFQ